MKTNRKITLVCLIIAFLVTVFLLRCEKEEKQPVKNKTEDRQWLDTNNDEYQDIDTPRDTTIKPPD